MTTQTQNVFKSNFGFHPVDYDGFIKLKEAHKILLRAYKDCKRFIRWTSKMDHNRNGEKPKAPEDYIEFGYHKLNKHSFYGPGFRKYKHNNLYLHILSEYRNARIPKECPEDVIQSDLPKDLDKIVAELSAFYET